jgi:hypothetical protein
VQRCSPETLGEGKPKRTELLAAGAQPLNVQTFPYVFSSTPISSSLFLPSTTLRRRPLAYVTSVAHFSLIDPGHQAWWTDSQQSQPTWHLPRSQLDGPRESFYKLHLALCWVETLPLDYRMLQGRHHPSPDGKMLMLAASVPYQPYQSSVDIMPPNVRSLRATAAVVANETL